MKIKSLIFLFSGIISTSLFSQNDVTFSADNSRNFDEQALKEKMKNDGLPQSVITKLIAQRKELLLKGKNVKWTHVSKKTNPVTNALCGDMGAENGWNAWLGDLGTANSGSQTWTPPPTLPATPNFSITSGTGYDSNTPGPNAGDPIIPFVCPGFGNASIQLGEPCVAGCIAEQLTYPLTVTPADTNFIYAYAIVIENAGHTVGEQPFVEFAVFDQMGNLIPQCANFIYSGGPSIPGFYYVSGTGCGWQGADQYKPWTFAGINLSAYIGTTVTIVITNVDCAQCGHWAYSYWDFSCGNIVMPGGCIGVQSTLCAPNDPSITYTYQWYQNGNVMIGSTQQCITVTPGANDTFSVEVQQPSGCNFFMNYSASVSSVQSLFTYSVNGNTVTFTNLSTGATSYAWDFDDGGTSTLQNPVYTYTANGTYTVCLAAANSSCTDTICKIITVPATAVEEYDLSSSVSVFPVPASGNVFVDFDNKKFGKTEISFSDAAGRIFFKTNISATEKQTLDISGFSDGIYFLKLKTDLSSGGYRETTKKVIVAR